MPRTEEAPGLIWRTRRNGTHVAYWVARKDLIKRGFRPKSVRLHFERDDPALAARCRMLQHQMIEWAANGGNARAPGYDGTFQSLVTMYETDRDSPYFELRQPTQRTYSKTMKSLMKHKGALRVDFVTGSDVKRWYKELSEAVSVAWAYYSINVLKSVLSYGATKRLTECLTLRQELREARFHKPTKGHEQLTYEQVVAFCAAAEEMNLSWMGRCIRLQFEFGMRRRDVIGEYVHDDGATAGIRIGNRVWRDGLTWQHINDNGIVRKLVSKTQFTSAVEAVHAIEDYPELAAELERTPAAERIGPLVINTFTGLPPTEAQCRRYYQRIAKRAGIPPEVKMMHARAGANTEIYEAGGTKEEAMALLTHTEEQTNRGYLAEVLKQSRRAAAKRVASRKNP